jgi:hypothetical protein
VVAGACAYEIFALTTRKAPTISVLCRRHHWFEALVLGALVVHLHSELY